MDAAQAFGKMKIDMKRDHIDMLTISGHKMGGPQGIGASGLPQNWRIKCYILIEETPVSRKKRCGKKSKKNIQRQK